MNGDENQTQGLRSLMSEWRLPIRYLHPRSPQAEKAAQRVKSLIGDTVLKQPEGVELKDLAERISWNWRVYKSITGLSIKDLRRAPWALFYPPGHMNSWLAGDKAITKAYTQWLESRSLPSAVAALLNVLIKTYPVRLRTFETWRRSAVRLLNSVRSLRLTRWRERCSAGMLLEADGAQQFAQAFSKSDEGATNFVERAGLTGILGDARFLQNAVSHLSSLIQKGLDADAFSGDSLKRHLDLYIDDSSLRFNDMAPKIADSLLLPYVERQPESDIQEVIQSFILKYIGDPRIISGTWQGIDYQARQVMYRWLVRVTLEDFFRLLDETAMDRHWQDRKEFWTDYLNQGVITDAWLVLGSTAKRLARRLMEGQSMAFGVLLGYGDSRQSVLLMKLKGLTIAEWSHNSKCRFWLDGNVAAPELHKKSYNRAELMDKGSNEKVVHYPTTWRAKCASYILRQTGIRRSTRSNERWQKRPRRY